MDNFQINKDEYPATLDKIELAEALWKSKIPVDFKYFLLRFNGGEIQPNIPSIKATTSSDFWQLWGIQRILSIEDIILQKRYSLGYTWKEQHEEAVLRKYDVNTDYLVTLAIAERGCYYINIDENQYGQMYFACYQDWDGFVRLETKSFDEFINSLRPYPDAQFSAFTKTRKVYDSRYFYTPDKPELGIQRFKEVLEFFGDPNSKAREDDLTVIQHYAYSSEFDRMNDYIFNYLLTKGGSIDGLLNRTRNIERIKKLIIEYNADINKSFNGRYPIIDYTGISSWNSVKENYNLIDQLLRLEIPINFDIKDDLGKTAIQRLKEMVIEYEKYREYNRNLWKTRPEMHNLITSEPINKLIKSKR